MKKMFVMEIDLYRAYRQSFPTPPDDWPNITPMEDLYGVERYVALGFTKGGQRVLWAARLDAWIESQRETPGHGGGCREDTGTLTEGTPLDPTGSEEMERDGRVDHRPDGAEPHHLAPDLSIGCEDWWGGFRVDSLRSRG